MTMTSDSLLSALKVAFDGTWRPNYGPPPADEPPDIVSLVDGRYECRSCRPPYEAPADGKPHAVAGHPRFDDLQVDIVDDRTVHLIGRRGPGVTFESTTTVTADGQTRTETWTAAERMDGVMVPTAAPMVAKPGEPRRQVLFTASAVRVGPTPAGAHLVSGTWKVVEMDLVNHDEDTEYRVEDRSLTMTDRLGRSFTAPLDGTVALYRGDPRFDGVSLRVIDDRTIEETNLSGDTVIQVTRWWVDLDGRTMHVRFDDLHGHVMEQSGHKLA